jgi:hypothetical protein
MLVFREARMAGSSLTKRALKRSMKVLFMTGYARNAIVHHGRLDPGVHLLAKPFTEQDLSRKSDEVLRSSDSRCSRAVE